MFRENYNHYLKKFGEKVKFYRNNLNVTQEKLAEMCGCSSQTISGIETGYNFPSFKLLFKLSDVLNVPAVYLFNFGEDKNIENIEKTSVVMDAYNSLNETQKNVILKVMQELGETKQK